VPGEDALDPALALEHPGHTHYARRPEQGPVALGDAWPQDDIDQPVLVVPRLAHADAGRGDRRAASRSSPEQQERRDGPEGKGARDPERGGGRCWAGRRAEQTAHEGGSPAAASCSQRMESRPGGAGKR
jgi:hypothetical protein